MTRVTSVIVIVALSAITSAKPGPYYTNLPVYNQYIGPYPHDHIMMRHVRSPSGSSSGSSSFSSSSSSSGGGSTSGTFMAPGPGASGTMNAFAGTNALPNNFGFPAGGFGYGGPPPNFYNQFDFFNFLQQYFNQLQQATLQAQAQAQEAANSGHGIYHKGPNYVYWSTFPNSNGGGYGGGGFSGGNFGGSDFVGGSATAEYSPQGGYGAASIFPPAEGGIDNRFGAETPSGPVNSVSGSFPAAPGTNGVFTSSSSGFSDINGKKSSFKTATVGVNKDGKVTTYTAHSP